MTEPDLIASLVAAQRAGTNAVDPGPYARLDRAAAYRVQTGVLAVLGERVGMLKTAIQADGIGVAAPIFASRMGTAPCRLSSVNVIGLEVEVGVVLAHDIPSSRSDDAAAVERAIDHFFLGVEVCGSRFPDRKAAGAMGGLADNMSGIGYVVGPNRARGADIAELEVALEFAGKAIYAAPAKHAFGDVLASLVAYARSQHPSYPLRAGTIVTTGSMCGLVAAKGTGRVRAGLGTESLEFDLV